uniref:Assembly factor for spindle microtubules n=1 Tax=Anas zonorhyncha TaxID=75864 RepID=A0A8B9VJV1_9AVES
MGKRWQHRAEPTFICTLIYFYFLSSAAGRAPPPPQGGAGRFEPNAPRPLAAQRGGGGGAGFEAGAEARPLALGALLLLRPRGAPAMAAWDLSCAAKPRRRRWSEDEEDPAVLVLSHFSRPPHLSFGSLRVGASRTRLLGIHNPNAEDVEVVVERVPPPARGFSIGCRRFSLQSGQTISVSVTWTPLEEGKVRELITFVINGIIKHQAVLLGVAEQPVKKKKSLWETMKKNNIAETSASIKVKKRNSEVKHVNETFEVSQKVERLRSPLQSCENQNIVENSTSPGNDSLIGSENKLPLSPISPVLQQCPNTAYTPVSMRRSTTFSDIASAVCEKLLPEIDFYNINKSVDNHDELKSESAYNFTGLERTLNSNNEAILNCKISRVCIPEHSASVPILSTRRILSPDSFVNDRHHVDVDTTEQCVPILSPDQFVKDSLAHVQPKTPKPETALISSAMGTYVVKRFLPPKWNKNGDGETKTQVHVNYVLNEAFETHNVESQVLHYSKPKENQSKFPSTEELQTSNSQAEQTKKRSVLSATVIKKKPDAGEGRRMETLQPKSKKCLNRAIKDCENVVPVYTKVEISKHLPVTDPVSAGNKCHNEKISSQPTAGSTSLCRKRKSEINIEKNRVTDPVYVEEVERKRTLTSMYNKKKTHTAVTTSAFKPTNQGRVGLKKKAGSSLQGASKTANKINKPIAGLAQSHLTFLKPLKTVIPRHPMPFAAKNMFYDERWKEKQQRGFTWWLNFVLTPDDFSVRTNTSQVNAAALILGEENHHKTSVPKAPTKEEASLKAYTAHRRLNKLRRDACRLFTSEEMVKAIKKLEVEIETRRLIVRRDRHLWKDVGERQKVLNWLLSYNPLWLRIGLETVYGELIPLESNSDVTGLAIFILNRLLWNPDIAAEYRHPTVPHLYQEGHEEALSKFTLKKMLLLVCFLDCAKQSRLIDHDPCLFCKDAEFKTSKDILLAISRGFLSGEGDLSRHLGFLGLRVSHIQTPLDEFDFAVTNLAVDLQCGIRLVRAMELLTKDWSLSKQLRVPAISRLQKMHNVDIVLNVLKERGIHLEDESGASIDCRDIVDRHRERTLALLWKIVFAFQVDVLLNVEQLKEEIMFLRNAHKIKTQLGTLKLFSNCCRIQEDNSRSSLPQNYSENVKLLMAWVNAVCGFYNIKVENFTVCFSDGRVLCHLIHHYHPCYVPLEAVCQRTTQTVECSRTHMVGLNLSSSSESDTSLNVMEGTFDQTSVMYKELLDNEKKNFQLISTAVSDLGGIPAMIHHSDMSNTIPDEKVVITYLSFLCSRLLDLRQETRAARLIQSAWRKYRLKKELKLSQERDRAARIIQKHAINFLSHRRILRKNNAAVLIQKHWRRCLARMKFLKLKNSKLEENRSKSATVIKAYWRRYYARKKYLQLRYYVIFIQAKRRMRVRLATIVLQSAYRGRKARKEAHILRSVIKIQSSYRAYIVRKRFKDLRDATVKIQAFVKMRQARRYYCALLEATLYVQQRYRSHRYALQLREDYRKLKDACIRIQAVVRGYLVRKQIQKWTDTAVFLQARYRMRRDRTRYLIIYRAVVVIQKHYRAYQKQLCQRQEFLQAKKAAVCLQAAYRGYKARKMLKLEYRAAVKIQTAFRAHAARTKYQAMIQASIVIQRWYRTCKTRNRQRLTFRLMNHAVLIIQKHYRASVIGRKQRQEYIELRNCVVRLQAIWRGKMVRKKIQKEHHLATIIQSYYRMHVNQLQFKKIRHSTLVIQRYFRAYYMKKQQRALYLKTKAAALVLQSAYRGMTVRKQLRKQRKAATTIQTAFRSYVVKKNYVTLRSAAIVVQRHYRAVIHAKWQKQKYLSLKTAVVKMQAIYRGMKVRRQIHRMHQAAICIQAMFKMHRINIRYRAMRMAAIIIQRQHRAFCLGKVQRQKYLELKKSTIILQAACRGMKVRRDLKTMHQSAAMIQSYYRMHRQQRDFRNLLLATRRIQQWFRACKERNAQVHNYMTVRSATLRLQAAFRGMKTRRLLRTMTESAEVIQRRFRTFLKRKHFISLRTAAIVIQRKYRATKLAKIQRQKYLSFLNAAVTIQSAYRGFVVRQKIQQMHQAAVVIQATLKMHKIYISYQALRLASIIIQQRYRAYREGKRVREIYLKQYNSVLVLQAAYRGMKTRCFLKKRHEAALIIQRNYRMYRQYHHYRKVQWATQLIQKRYRANNLRNIAVQRYSSLKKAVICIQKAFRDMRLKKLLQEKHRAAIVVQKNFKAFRERQRYLSLKAATLVFQRRYRALILSRQHAQEYLCLRRATILLQAVYRGIRVRKSIECMHLAATTIQSAYKMHRKRRSYQNMRIAAIAIQNYYRSYIKQKNQQKEYLTMKKSALVIQAYYRGTKERQKLKLMHASATVIQSSYRTYVQHRYYKQLCWAARVIQQRFRAKVAKEADMENYAKTKKAVICLQSSFRAKKARQLYKTNLAALRIQSFFRMYVERKRLLAKKAAAITIQSAFRCQRTRARYKLIQNSIVAIQRWYRACHRARLQKAEYSAQKQAIVIIQSACRGMKARKTARQIRAARKIQSFLWMAVHRRKFIQLKTAAITIEAYYLMYKAKSQYASYKKAAVVLQRWYKSCLIVKCQRTTYLQTRKKIIIVQARVKGFIERKRFHKMKESAIKIQISEQKQKKLLCFIAAAYHHVSAIKIQRAYRMHLTLKLARNHISSVLIIQRWFRAKMQQKRFLRHYQRIIQLQRMIRVWLNRRNDAATIIQRSIRRFLACRRNRKFANGIIKFQALWRGYSWRKSNDTAKTRVLRRRLEKANEKSKEEEKLCNRTAIAIEHLLKYKHLSYVLAALKHLEVVTRLSPLCCENMVQSRAIFSIFVLIRSCNRSVPCMDVIRYSIQVLLNVSKYERTTQAVYEVENSIDTLLNLLQMYRAKAGDKISEKGGSIFTKTCCLLAILSKDSKRALEIRNLPRAVACIQSLYKLTAHKCKMDAERTLVKQKTNPLINGTSFIPVIPLRTTTVSRIKPDWVLRKDNIQEIVDPLQAILMVMDTLGIACYEN